MQRGDISRWDRPGWKSMMVWVCFLSALIGVGQSSVSGATEQQTPSSGTAGEKRFLQQFISRALDQKESTQKGVDTPLRDSSGDSREARTAPPLPLSTTNQAQLRYTTATTTMVLALGATLAVLGISGYLVRRYLLKQRPFGKRENPLRVLARVNITPKAAVALLEAPGKLLVIGITGSTLTALGEIPVTAVDTENIVKSNHATSFAAALDQHTQPTNGQPPVDDPLLQVPEHIQRKVSGLKQL